MYSTCLTTAAALLGSLIGITQAVNIVEVRGQDFVDTVTGNRFQILGVDYQPGGSASFGPGFGDPLSNGTLCLRDAALMQRLGFNTLRVYNLDPTLNHDECASIFNAVGIYMILDVNSPLPGGSLVEANAARSYTADYLRSRPFAIIEAFKNFPNVLGFFSSNELIHVPASFRPDPPYIRAVQRDMKNYIANHAPRAIPVGYSAADVREVLTDQWNYLQCSLAGDNNDRSRSDFMGLNSYSWCGTDATFDTSGYDDLVALFSSTTIPIFFSEYGCNVPSPRVFNEVPVLYGPQMTVLSGGLVYEYAQEANNFGLVLTNPDGSAHILNDYDNLQAQFSKLNISLIEASNSTATSLTAPPCSSGLISSSGFSNNFNLPDPPAGIPAVIQNGLSSPNVGNLVDVTQTKVTVPVYASNGDQINNLAIKPVSGGSGNTPGQTTARGTGTARSSATGASASSTSRAAAAAPLKTGMVGGLLGVGLAVGAILA